MMVRKPPAPSAATAPAGADRCVNEIRKLIQFRHF